MAERENGDIQVIARCAQILRAIEPGSRLRLSALASDLGMGRSTAHRYLTSMSNAGLLQRVGEGEYTLGPLLVELGTMALNDLHVVEVAGATMQQLTEEAGETVVMSVWGGFGPVVTRTATPDKLIQVGVRVGSRLPLDAAQTMVFLAFLEDRRSVENVLTMVPERRQDIEASMTETRQLGLAISNGFIAGLRTIAVPVLDSRGISATLAIVGTTSAVPADPHAGMAQALARAGEALSRHLGFIGDYPFRAEY
jgi:DNA-binding IclR family transcriptional regulator